MIGERPLGQGERIPIFGGVRRNTLETFRREDRVREAPGVRRRVVHQLAALFRRQAQTKLLTERREKETRSLKTQHFRGLVDT